MFFRAGGHERPYGYAVIDHANRMVHKGGDIFQLGQILGESDGVGNDKRERKKIGRPVDEYDIMEFRASSEDGSLMSAFDAFIVSTRAIPSCSACNNALLLLTMEQPCYPKLKDDKLC